MILQKQMSVVASLVALLSILAVVPSGAFMSSSENAPFSTFHQKLLKCTFCINGQKGLQQAGCRFSYIFLFSFRFDELICVPCVNLTEITFSPECIYSWHFRGPASRVRVALSHRCSGRHAGLAGRLRLRPHILQAAPPCRLQV